jgi:2-polyprenyl-3-methyl-5-hydroxy-6-metoxy-1,4-benzoquinol methylase
MESTSVSSESVSFDWLNVNRAYWDERVPNHVTSKVYDVPGFVAGNDTLRPWEVGEVGEVSGKSLLHLMCHIGLDTLSWARRGATVTGLDFSQPALDVAASLAEQIGIETARFVSADVYDAASTLDGQTFDIVYTGVGVNQWLPDIDRWAQTVAALVAPGGFFYMTDFHPFGDIIDDDVRCLRRGYFDRGPFIEEESGSYAGATDTQANTMVKWTHHIGSVVNALAIAGLRLEFLHEYDFTVFPSFYGLEKSNDGMWRFPPGRWTIPHMFSLRASKDT